MTWLIAAFVWTAGAEPVCATKSITTLRKSASDRAPISWRVSRYMPFLRLERKNGWSKVRDFEGETHWARGNDVTNAVRCVVVKTNVAALHRDPETSSAATDLKTVDRYTPFLRVADQEGWVQVKDEAGRTAWIAAGQVWKPVMINSITF